MRGLLVAMLFALIATSLTPYVSEARARRGEVIQNSATYAPVNDESETESTSSFGSGNPLQLIVDGSLYDSQYRTKIPSVKQVAQVACPANGRYHPRSLCPAWPSMKRSFEAAAKAMGIPAPALICVMKAESNFVPGLTSGAGAAGLMQFMPDTARHFENIMRSTPEYQKRWNDYRKAGGTDRGVHEFTQFNIRSARPMTADVQIFATAMYFHYSMKGIAGPIKRSLGPPPEPNGAALRRLMHYWLAAYNGGISTGIRFLRNLQTYGPSAYGSLPRETKGYIRKFDACVGEATRN